jgi:hypothetical protein
MNKYALSSLLKWGTKTWHGGGHSGDYELTINLVLALEDLIDLVIKYAILGMEHCLDHYAIKTVFNALWSLLKH